MEKHNIDFVKNVAQKVLEKAGDATIVELYGSTEKTLQFDFDECCEELYKANKIPRGRMIDCLEALALMTANDCIEQTFDLECYVLESCCCDDTCDMIRGLRLEGFEYKQIFSRLSKPQKESIKQVYLIVDE